MNSFQICLVLAASCVLAASASYDFTYGVSDPSTGDVKEQQESKSGDQVSGHYKTLDADGLTRTVIYKSNPITGFQVHVSRQWSPDSAAAPVIAVAPQVPAMRVVRPVAGVFPRAPEIVQHIAGPVGAQILRASPYAALRSAALVRPQYTAPDPIAETNFLPNIFNSKASPVAIVPYGLPPSTSYQSYGGY